MYLRAIRLFLLFEGATFVAASLVHFGKLLEGYRHQQAGTAEAVIAAVLMGSGRGSTTGSSIWTGRSRPLGSPVP
jgi:hypothetical protein